MPDSPKLPLLCDHDGCKAPAVGKYVVGNGQPRPNAGFETVVRCREHAGGAEMKERVNEEK